MLFITESKREFTAGIGIYIVFFGMMIGAYLDPIIWPSLGVSQGYGAHYTIFLAVGTLFAGIFTPLGAKLCALYSRKRVYIIATSLYAFSYFLQGFFPAPEIMLFLRALTGISLAFLFPAMLTLLGDIFPPEKRGFWIGIEASIMGIAGLAVPFLSGAALDFFPPGFVFFAIIPFCLIGMITVAFSVKEKRTEKQSEPFDFRGAVALFMLFASFLSITNFGPDIFSSSHRSFYLLIIVFFLFLYLTFRIEKKADPNGIIPLSAFSQNNFRNLALGTFLNECSNSFFYYLFPFYMLSVMGLSNFEMGIAIGLQFLISLFFAPWFGKVLGKKGESFFLTVIPCISMILICLFFLLFVNSHTPYWMIVIGMVIFGLYAMFSTVYFPFASQNRIPDSLRSYSAGIIRIAQTFGKAISLSLMTLSLDYFSNRVEFCYDLIYIVSIVLTCATLYFTLQLRKDA